MTLECDKTMFFLPDEEFDAESPFLTDEEVDALLDLPDWEERKRKSMPEPTKQERYDQMYMDIAARCAKMSYAIRAKVGSVIVKDDNIISMGWNGMPSGMSNDCEDRVYSTKVTLSTEQVSDIFRKEFPYTEHIAQGHYRRYKLVTKPEVLHSEQNAVCKAAKSGTALKGATMYVTLAPCMNCAAIVYNAGISRLVYQNEYKGAAGSAGVKFLKDRGLEVHRL